MTLARLNRFETCLVSLFFPFVIFFINFIQRPAEPEWKMGGFEKQCKGTASMAATSDLRFDS